jgi:hypothetical protein
MLHNCTWQAFLIAAILFSLLWLVIILLLFYRKELNAFLSGSAREPVEPLDHAWADDFEQAEDDGLMGKPALPDGVSILEQDEFSFVPAKIKPGIDLTPNDELLQGDVFDLMEQVKPIFGKPGMNKEAFIDLVNEEVRDFPRLMESPLLDSVYEQVCQQVNDSAVLEFELSVEELKENL